MVHFIIIVLLANDNNKVNAYKKLNKLCVDGGRKHVASFCSPVILAGTFLFINNLCWGSRK